MFCYLRAGATLSLSRVLVAWGSYDGQVAHGFVRRASARPCGEAGSRPGSTHGGAPHTCPTPSQTQHRHADMLENRERTYASLR
eukprot:6135582-Pyramimonas_sp.AAC.1